MPWICVDNSVDGPKLRELYKELNCSMFEALGVLNCFWFWGLNNADKSGKILGADEDDIARYLYSKAAKSKLDTHAVVKALIKLGWIDKTENGLYIHDWEDWQEPWYKARERRKKDAERKREIRKRSANSDGQVELFEDEEQNDNAGAVEQKEPEAKAEKDKYDNKFLEFWDAYPRKADKGMAYKKYKSRRKDGFSDDELIEAAKAYAAECSKKGTEMQYIKHAKTFLGDSTPFMDYLPKKSKNEIVLAADWFSDVED